MLHASTILLPDSLPRLKGLVGKNDDYWLTFAVRVTRNVGKRVPLNSLYL